MTDNIFSSAACQATEVEQDMIRRNLHRDDHEVAVARGLRELAYLGDREELMILLTQGTTIQTLRTIADRAGVKVPSKGGKSAIVDAIIAARFAPTEQAPSPSEAPIETPRRHSSHADCTHPATKSARAACRRSR